MSNLSFETVDTQWFDPNAIRLPDYKVGRINYGQGRSYIRIVDGELETPFRLYTSLTTCIGASNPMEDGLLQWHCKLGYEEARRYTKMKGHYGTLYHLLLGDFLKTLTFDFEEIENRVQEYLSEHSYFERECSLWEQDLRYDVAAFIQFVVDYKVIPLGIEYVLLSDRGYGTLIDLVCKMTIENKGFHGEVYASGPRKGEPKETKQEEQITAVINFKSGRHPFSRSNGIQVEFEKLLWNENFPDIPVTNCFNFSPKEWHTTPSYNLKDWTEEIDQAEVDAVLALADIRYGAKALNKKYVSVGGQYYSTRGLDQCVKIVPVEEWARKKYGNMMPGAKLLSGSAPPVESEVATVNENEPF